MKNNINKISDNFSKYKIKRKKETMTELCLPKKYTLQEQQKFLRDYFGSKYSKNGLLIYHKIGAGKTCTAVSIAEKFKTKMKILVVLPASLIGNFRDELRSQCADENYISQNNRDLLKTFKPRSKMFKKIINESNNKINKFYTIYSYHKFSELCEYNKIKLKNTLLIIDEVQNMVSDSGTFYNNLKDVVDKADSKSKLILLSATPMFDKPVELALTMNLFRLNKEMPTGKEFSNMFLKPYKINNEIHYKIKNINKLKPYLNGFISYYRGASPKAFPKENFNIVRCKMEHFQYKSYMTSLSTEEHMKHSFTDADILDLSTSFLLGPRLISNISFPNKSIGTTGLLSLKKNYLKTINIKKYSKKFYKIYNKINSSQGPIFIYSNFKDSGGIKSLVKFFEYNGYKNYKTYGEGKKRYAVWSGDETTATKDAIKFTFNQPDNYNGSKIKILFGTPSIKEGVSLLRVEQVHILEPYWNMSRILQIIGRAIRFCSHKDLPTNKRFVDIFLYLATHPDIKKTADQKVWSMAKRKHVLINQFEDVLKESAIDCKIFYNRNVYPGEKPIKCG